MTRQKMEIKRIDNITAREVTFSRRKKGLFKKAQELSTLCDAEIALVVFSGTGKLSHYASSSMEQVFERRRLHSELVDGLYDPVKIENETHNMLRKDLAFKTHELSQLMGEKLQGSSFEELQELEERLETSLSTVSKAKDLRAVKEMSALKRKGIQIMEENRILKQMSLAEHSSQSNDSCSSSGWPQDNEYCSGCPCLNKNKCLFREDCINIYEQ